MHMEKTFSVLVQKSNSLVILKKLTIVSCGRVVDCFEDDIHRLH